MINLALADSQLGLLGCESFSSSAIPISRRLFVAERVHHSSGGDGNDEDGEEDEDEDEDVQAKAAASVQSLQFIQVR